MREYFTQFCCITVLIFITMNSVLGETKPVISTSDRNEITLDNGIVNLTFDRLSKHFSVSKGDRSFLKEASISSDPDSGSASVLKVVDRFGSGCAIQIQHPSGELDLIAIYENSPFVFTRSNLKSGEMEDISFETIPTLSAKVDLKINRNDLRVFGCESVQSIDEKRTSYSFTTVTDPKSRESIVFGYLTHSSGSGIVTVEPCDDTVVINARTEYGQLRLAPSDSRDGEIVVIGHFDDGLEGLEAYADAVARIHDVRLPKVPSGYCTWYHARASDEKRMAELADFCHANLKEYGFDFMQIDDFWQVSTVTEKRDFTTHKPDGPYPSGMKATAENIDRNGFTAGLWLIPFAWNPEAPSLIEHHDWFMKNKEGDINLVSWAGYCLDNTNPETRKFVGEVISRITKDWGYKYLKLDGLWSGMGIKQLYPTPDYRPDRLGEAILHDKYKTQIEAYRMGLDNVRRAAGGDVFLLGCNIAQNMRTMGGSFGLVDGMRVGRDIGARWDKIVPCAALASSLYFFHNRVWYNDPDCLMLRDPLTLDQARAWGSLIGISGCLNIVSEWLPDLPPEKLDVFKRTLPNHGLCGRPVDLFDKPIAQIWHVSIGEENLKREIVGLFNWDDASSSNLTLELDKLGLNEGRYIGFDFWENEFIEPFSECKEFVLRPSSCKAIVLQPLSDCPQLISTSRHITQGGVDVLELKWDASQKVLSGVSSVVGGDPYELRIRIPNAEDWQPQSALMNGKTIDVDRTGTNLRVSFVPNNTQTIEWSVSF